MVWAGRRWRVTDLPTPLWQPDGWRFQGTSEDGQSLVFDVVDAEDGWHVHRSYE